MSTLRSTLGCGSIALFVLTFGCGSGESQTQASSSAASSGSSTATTGSGSGGAGGEGTATTATTASGSTTTGTSTSSSAGAGGGGGQGGGSSGVGGSGGSPPLGLASLGTLVVLGDSISDGGGQPPFYYDLLKADLQAKYGAITYHNKAQSGSETDSLVSQINSLPNSLPGPIAVTITSGGNDMKAAIVQVLTGTDAAKKQELGDNVDAALDLLLAPNAFGPGVLVYVFEGNIYDASDGAGDFGSHGCAFGQGLPAFPSDTYFDAWNQVIADRVSQHGQTSADMHDYFYGHGYNSPPSWYASDCTHPSTVGHAALRDLFYSLITGEPAP